MVPRIRTSGGIMIFEDQLESVERASYDKGDDYVNLRC
jgi:hypothetical protein